MKFPSASAGGTSPSANSFASTYPGVCGSRAGGAGRAGRRAAGGGVVGGATGSAAGALPGLGTQTANRLLNTATPRRLLVIMNSTRAKGFRPAAVSRGAAANYIARTPGVTVRSSHRLRHRPPEKVLQPAHRVGVLEQHVVRRQDQLPRHRPPIRIRPQLHRLGDV